MRSCGFFLFAAGPPVKIAKQFHVEITDRMAAMVQHLVEHHGAIPGGIAVGLVICNACGREAVITSLMTELPGWVGGPPDFCPTCVQQ
jgi:hypothetical protein